MSEQRDFDPFVDAEVTVTLAENRCGATVLYGRENGAEVLVTLSDEQAETFHRQARHLNAHQAITVQVDRYRVLPLVGLEDLRNLFQ